MDNIEKEKPLTIDYPKNIIWLHLKTGIFLAVDIYSEIYLKHAFIIFASNKHVYTLDILERVINILMLGVHCVILH